MYRIVSKGVDVPLWKCLSHLKVNTVRRRNTADGSVNNTKLAEQMASKGPDGTAGWDFQYPGILFSPTMFPFRDIATNEPLDEKKLFDEALAARADYYERLKIDAKSADELAGFRYLFCDADGRLLTPKFGEHHWTISGNQRLVNVVAPAAGLALKRGITFKKTMPAIIIESDSMIEIQEEQIRGNKFQETINKMGKLDLLGPAINFVRLGMNEQRFCELVASGNFNPSDDKDDANNPENKKVDKNLGRFVYKLAQVANACINLEVPFMDLLTEGVGPKQREKGSLPIENFKMTGGSVFDLSLVYRCLVDVNDPVNGLALYVRKYKQDKSENLTDEEKDVYRTNSPWGKARLQQWVNSVAVGGDAKVPEAKVKPTGMMPDVAKSKVNPIGSNLLAEYVHAIVADDETSSARSKMADVGKSIDSLPLICGVAGGRKLLEMLSHFVEQRPAEAAAIIQKIQDVIEHALTGQDETKKSRKKEATAKE